jgi:hypothetical protein
MVRLARGQISGASYNPRKITPAAKKKLQAILKGIKLLEPITVSTRLADQGTYLLVGGHQRLAALDALEGNADYFLDVAGNDLTEQEEKEAILVLNNLELQGEWDLPLLAALIPEVNLEHTGFEPISLDIIFDGSEFSPMFGEQNQPPEAQSAIGALAAMSMLNDDPASVAGDEPAPPSGDEEVKRKASAEAVAQMRKSSKGMSIAEDTSRFLVVIFNTRAECEAFNERVGLDKSARYVPFALLEPSLRTG